MFAKNVSDSMQLGAVYQTRIVWANRCRCSRGLKRQVPGSARVSRVWQWCLAIANFLSRNATSKIVQ
jgi:hypothetical protein